jgi:RecA-family ATPase
MGVWVTDEDGDEDNLPFIVNYTYPPADDATAFRRAAWQNAFRIVPVRTREKRPAENNWLTLAREVTIPNFIQEGQRARPDAMNTGIICDKLRAIDVDVDDAEAAERIEEIARDLLGDAPVRFRVDSSRVLMLYRAAEGAPPKMALRGELGSVEILGFGQQFVADGVHPDGETYQWRGGSPATVRRADLPAVSEEHIAHFFDDVAAVIRATAPGAHEAHEAPQEGGSSLPEVILPPDVHEHPRVRAWADAAFQREVEAVRSQAKGGRNARLNDAAHSLGTLVPHLLSSAQVRAALESACVENGLWKEDGPNQCRATINSGLTAGMGKPRDLPPDILAAIEEEREGAEIAAVLLRQADGSLRETTGVIIDAPDPLAVLRCGLLPTVCAADFEGQPIPRREWLAEGLIPARTVTLFSGDGGVGKSLVALQLAISTARGVPWLGIEVKHGPALFLTAEDDLDEVHRRLADVARALNCPLGYFDKLHIASLAGEDALLATQERSNSKIVKATALFDRLKARVDTLKPALVVLDTLADLFGGEENDRAQARQFIGLLRGLATKYGTTVVLLSHPSLSGMASGTGSSGSTAWSNSVRSRLYLRRPEKIEGKDADPDTRILETMKANYGKTGTRFALRWKEGVFVREAGVDEATGETLATHADRVFAELLAIYEQEGRDVSPSASPTYAPSVFAKDHRAAGLTKSDLTNAMNRHLARGVIKIVTKGPPSHERKRLVTVNADTDEGEDAQSEMDE